MKLKTKKIIKEKATLYFSWCVDLFFLILLAISYIGTVYAFAYASYMLFPNIGDFNGLIGIFLFIANINFWHNGRGAQIAKEMSTPNYK